MTKTLQVELPDAIYDALEQLAQHGGQSAGQMVAEWLSEAPRNMGGDLPPKRRDRQRQPDEALSTADPLTSARPVAPPADTLYELQISLRESRPAIWRRLQVPSGITLLKLHRAIQVLMGWQDYHLHQFTVNGAVYGQRVADWQKANPDMRDERGVHLARLAPTVGTRLLYEYDFGDGWALEIVVERIQRRHDGAGYAVCLGGQRAGPPEDVGGIGGYEEFVQAIRQPRHPEHDSWLQWVGGPFDPERFDVSAVNQALARIR
jgi:hypothetical protein